MKSQIFKEFIVIAIGSIIAAYISINIFRPNPEEPVTTKTEISGTDRILGNKDADLTLIEYGSLDCTKCTEFHTKEFLQIKNEYIDTGKIKYIYRHFPIKKTDFVFAYVAESLPEKDYYDFIMHVYKNQNDLDHLHNIFGGTKDINEAVKKDIEETVRKMAGKYVSSEEMDNILEETEENKIISNRIFTEKFLFKNEYDIKYTPTFFLFDSKNLNIKIQSDYIIEKLKLLSGKP